MSRIFAESMHSFALWTWFLMPCFVRRNCFVNIENVPIVACDLLLTSWLNILFKSFCWFFFVNAEKLKKANPKPRKKVEVLEKQEPQVREWRHPQFWKKKRKLKQNQNLQLWSDYCICRGALCFCLGAHCKVPIQTYHFSIAEVPLTRETWLPLQEQSSRPGADFTKS